MAELIKFNNVCKSYKNGEVSINALDKMSFTINEGEFVVIIGPSGAGKTTLLNLLGGMDNITSGEIFFDNHDISKLSEKNLMKYRRYDVGFVFQFYNLMPNLTAKENIEFAIEVSKKNSMLPDKALELVGLTNRSKNFPSQLSGGEQQRVSIARAIAKRPKIILCDEPTGALDYQTGKQILKLLYSICKEEKKTIIVVTHNSVIKDMADKIIKIKNGQVENITINKKPKPIEKIEW